MHILGKRVVVGLKLDDDFDVLRSIIGGGEAVKRALFGDVVHQYPGEGEEADTLAFQRQRFVAQVQGIGSTNLANTWACRLIKMLLRWLAIRNCRHGIPDGRRPIMAVRL